MESTLQLVSIQSVATLTQQEPGETITYPVDDTQEETFTITTQPGDKGIKLKSNTDGTEYLIPFKMGPYVCVL